MIQIKLFRLNSDESNGSCKEKACSAYPEVIRMPQKYANDVIMGNLLISVSHNKFYLIDFD
jgi:hypothetical protein